MPLSSECWIVDRSPAGTAAMPSFEDAVKTAEEMGIADHALPRLALAIGRRLGLGQDALDELRLWRWCTTSASWPSPPSC